MESSVFVAGGAGFIGSNLCYKLSSQYDKVIVVDNLCRGRKSFLEKLDNLVFIDQDLSQDKSTCQLVEDLQKKYHISEVWHLAANSDIPAGVSDPSIDLRDTFLTTFSLANAFEVKPPKNFLFASSSAVYGDMGKNYIQESSAPLFPISNYGAMKLASEAYLSSWIEKNHTRLIIFRFPNVVGVPSTHGVILDFIKKLSNNPKKLNVLGDGKQRKPYLLVDDLISAMSFILENTNNKREVFNIGPKDSGTQVSDIAKMVCSLTGNSNAEIIYEESNRGWVGDVPKFEYDISKLEELGWSNKNNSSTSIKIAIQQIYDEFNG